MKKENEIYIYIYIYICSGFEKLLGTKIERKNKNYENFIDFSCSLDKNKIKWSVNAFFLAYFL